MTRRLVLAAAFLAGTAASVHAQTPTGLTADLIADITEVETKVLGLATAMNAAQYDWRPAAGVRSVGEVLMHIAADNYFLGIPLGAAPPTASGIKADDYPSVQAYENRKLARDATIAEVRASFEHLKRALAQVPDSRMNTNVKLFGRDFTTRRVLVLTTTHLHEHLGQLIAYARSNNVVPPWSR